MQYFRCGLCTVTGNRRELALYLETESSLREKVMVTALQLVTSDIQRPVRVDLVWEYGSISTATATAAMELKKKMRRNFSGQYYLPLLDSD